MWNKKQGLEVKLRTKILKQMLEETRKEPTQPHTHPTIHHSSEEQLSGRTGEALCPEMLLIASKTLCQILISLTLFKV